MRNTLFINFKNIMFSLALLLILQSQSAAQNVETKSPVSQKTMQQMVEEYKKWTRVRDDWPGLNRYREANSKLEKPRKNEQRIVFIGNSIIDNWINLSPEFFEGKSYVNRGISGQTTPQILARFRADVIALEPKIVVILAGTNDIAGNTGPSTLEMIEDNYASMTELAKANGIRVILCSVLPVYDYPWRRGLEPAEKIASLNKWIKSYCAKHDVGYLDFYSSLVDKRKGMKYEYTFDGVHPNREGYKVMEALAEKAIAKSAKKLD
ncbi:SGNH/GDSL hydrolase family protein [Thermophagus sp. OGC60D27]|uniref:SGNH/GDSL hydrolase family protein n=1 Tax=Thermophagus sp. OGC60D27 TaxID=3458415 RepID=UPI004037DC25